MTLLNQHLKELECLPAYCKAFLVLFINPSHPNLTLLSNMFMRNCPSGTNLFQQIRNGDVKSHAIIAEGAPDTTFHLKNIKL